MGSGSRLTNAQLRRRLTLAAVWVLVLGLAASSLAYVFVEEPPAEAGAYILVDGLKYPVDPSTSKRYVRNLEMMGGKASVVMDEFARWFGGLWSGRRLWSTLAALSVAGAAALLGIARLLHVGRSGAGRPDA